MVKGFKYSRCLCKFLDGVVCPHKRTVDERKRFSVAKFCFECSYYGQYVDEFEKEDDRIMEEIELIQKYGYDFVDKVGRLS